MMLFHCTCHQNNGEPLETMEYNLSLDCLPPSSKMESFLRVSRVFLRSVATFFIAHRQVILLFLLLMLIIPYCKWYDSLQDGVEFYKIKFFGATCISSPLPTRLTNIIECLLLNYLCAMIFWQKMDINSALLAGSIFTLALIALIPFFRGNYVDGSSSPLLILLIITGLFLGIFALISLLNNRWKTGSHWFIIISCIIIVCTMIGMPKIALLFLTVD